MKSYCVKQRKQTECVEPSDYKTAKNGRLSSFVLVLNGALKKLDLLKSGKLNSLPVGAGIVSNIGNTAAQLFLTKGIPYLGKKAVEMGRYYTSEMLRDPKLQNKAIDYALNKLYPAIQNVGSHALNQLSAKIRPKKKYKTNRKDLDGSGFDLHKAIVNYQDLNQDLLFLVINILDHIIH